MPAPYARRGWIKTMSAAGGSALVPTVTDPLPAAASASAPAAGAVVSVADKFAPADIVEPFSTSDVFIPPERES